MSSVCVSGLGFTLLLLAFYHKCGVLSMCSVDVLFQSIPVKYNVGVGFRIIRWQVGRSEIIQIGCALVYGKVFQRYKIRTVREQSKKQIRTVITVMQISSDDKMTGNPVNNKNII